MADEPQGDSTLLSQPETTPANWYGESSKELVESKGWKTADDAVNSYRELEKNYSGRVKMLSPESSAEEIRAFYQKTGCPENPEGYETNFENVPESLRDEGIEAVMKQIAYDNGISKQGFEAVVKGYYDRLQADMSASRDAGEKALKEELGVKYDEEIAIGRRFCDTCSDEFRDLLERTGLGNNPIFIKEFITKGRQIMSDTLIKGSSDSDGEKGYVPKYKDSPEMYATGEDDESKRARAYFEAQGHKY